MTELHTFRPPLVAILRGLAPEQARAAALTLFESGFRIVEVPLNRRGALYCIEAIAAVAPPDALVGGGTMLSTRDVDDVHEAGGRLMVAPNCDADVMRRAAERGMAVVPGVATPTEAFNALRWRANALKIFPAEMVGLAGLKAFKSVLPEGTPLWPVGGVTTESLASWVKAGATGFGIGGQLFQPGTTLHELGRRAREFVAVWHAATAVSTVASVSATAHAE
ncbi:MAG TPA: 2-dehydro-3-deoxy-6-phosphogalactonate aldolase [Rhizobacter sp.]